MLVQHIPLIQNDVGYQTPFTLEDERGSPVNLSGATSCNPRKTKDVARTAKRGVRK